MKKSWNSFCSTSLIIRGEKREGERAYVQDLWSPGECQACDLPWGRAGSTAQGYSCWPRGEKEVRLIIYLILFSNFFCSLYLLTIFCHTHSWCKHQGSEPWGSVSFPKTFHIWTGGPGLQSLPFRLTDQVCNTSSTREAMIKMTGGAGS